MPPSHPAATITSLDHLVLTVKSIAASKDWYTEHLGMRYEVFVSGVTRHALIFGNSKINPHELGMEFEPKAKAVQPGSADLCFLTDDDVSRVRERLVKANVEMVDLEGRAADDGTVMRTGAKGKLRSVYCRDPDGNLRFSINRY